MPETDQMESTLAAMAAAVEAARTANHAAYHAPRTTGSVYGRVAELHDLLGKTEQLARVLGQHARALTDADGLYSDDGHDPRHMAGAAAAELAGAAELIAQAGFRVNAAWSTVGHLGQGW